MMHRSEGSSVKLPRELLPFRHLVEGYVDQRIQEFALNFSLKINPALPSEHVLRLAQDTLALLHAPIPPAVPVANLRLVLKHDCESSGCGDNDCILCQFNPTRLCKRNLKQKYLIDDNLRAKCGANVRIELNDESGRLVPNDVMLEIDVLSWDRYKEVCSQGPVTSIQALRQCRVREANKALLRREGGRDTDDTRVVLQLERGVAQLSELQATTSSEALLSGKAPGFMLLVAAVDGLGEPVPHIQYVVSEKFVVTTKRVKQAIKSDIPTVDQHVSKLVHIGRATVDKLVDLRAAAQEEANDIDLPEDLGAIEKVGQFQRLVELAEHSSDFKAKLLKLLKLSPEKWEEVAQHAQAAVVPDFRPRIWVAPVSRVGLLFNSKHAAVQLETPVALVHLSKDQGEDYAVPIQQLDPGTRSHVQELRRQAKAAWYMPGHPNWAVYWKDNDHINQLCQTTPTDADEDPASTPSTSRPPATSAPSTGPSGKPLPQQRHPQQLPLLPPSSAPMDGGKRRAHALPGGEPPAHRQTTERPGGGSGGHLHPQQHVHALAPSPTVGAPGGGLSHFPGTSQPELLHPGGGGGGWAMPPASAPGGGHPHGPHGHLLPHDRTSSGATASASPFAASIMADDAILSALGGAPGGGGGPGGPGGGGGLPPGGAPGGYPGGSVAQQQLALKLASAGNDGAAAARPWGGGGGAATVNTASLEMLTSEELKLADAGISNSSSDRWLAEMLQGAGSSLLMSGGGMPGAGASAGPPGGGSFGAYGLSSIDEGMGGPDHGPHHGVPGVGSGAGLGGGALDAMQQTDGLSVKLSMSLDLDKDVDEDEDDDAPASPARRGGLERMETGGEGGRAGMEAAAAAAVKAEQQQQQQHGSSDGSGRPRDAWDGGLGS